MSKGSRRRKETSEERKSFSESKLWCKHGFRDRCKKCKRKKK